MSIEDNMKRGDVPTTEQWAALKAEGWTAERWNAEMDARRAQNASDDRLLMWTCLIALVFGAFMVMGR